MDRHESEVRHHQNKIDAQAEEFEREQEEREAEAAKIDWKEVGEDHIRDFTEDEKADAISQLKPWELANVFDYLVMQTTDWIPNEPFKFTNLDVSVKDYLKVIRDNQAALAEDHYLKTGEME